MYKVFLATVSLIVIFVIKQLPSSHWGKNKQTNKQTKKKPTKNNYGVIGIY